MATCRFDPCNRNADYNTNDGYCILHSPNPDKDRENFEKALLKRFCLIRDDFSHIVFPRDFNFFDRDFTDSSFFQATFTGRVNFENATFKGGRADFQLAVFRGTANFNGATFTAEPDFRGARFEKDVHFSRATFEKGVWFEEIAFAEDANFYGAKFCTDEEFAKRFEKVNTQETDQSDIEETRRADFARVTFQGPADFTSACFAYEGDFRGVQFNERAGFSMATFTEKAKVNFVGVRFAEEANFIKARLKNGGDFTSVTFEKGAHFRGATFGGRVVFNGASFRGSTLFAPESVLFPKKGSKHVPIFSGAEVFFTQVTMEPPDAVIFRDADLKKCWFQGTDLRKVEITGAIWPEMDRPFPLVPKRIGIYDEQGPLGEGRARPWSHIERVYRELKQNCEDRRDYERARDFHYGEKEMRRKNPKIGWGLWGLLGLYWLVSGYSERALRPFLWGVGLLGICTALYLWLGLRPSAANDALTCSDWGRALEYSFRVMILLKPDDLGLAPQGWARVVFLFESIAGPVLLGLFGLALRQRLKR